MSPARELTLHVAIDARMAADGGIGTYLQALVPRIARTRPGWSLTLLGDPAKMTALGWDALPNATMERCGSSHYTIGEQLELPLSCPRLADVFWAPHYNMPLLLRRPIVVTVHDICHLALPDATNGWLEQRYARFMFSQVARRAAAVVYVSEFSRSEMQRFSPPRGLTAVVPNAVDEKWFCAKTTNPSSPSPDPYVVYVGNWKRHKNVPALLRAFDRVRDRIPHRLVLIGRRDGLNADAAIDAELSRLGPRAIFLGEIGDAQLRQWVAHADALVTTSLYEGFGLPPLEAMAAGCPCVVSTAGSLPEVCGDAALYADPRDERAIAAQLIDILTDSALRSRLIDCGRARARSYNWDRSAEATAQLLERAGSSRGTSRAAAGDMSS